MYKQTLYKIVKERINPQSIKRIISLKNGSMVIIKNMTVIVISKTGQIGEIYEIQNLVIALPAE